MRRIVAGLITASMLAGCSASPQSFYENPAEAKETALCRTALDESKDQKFRTDVARELDRRGVTLEDCRYNIRVQNAAFIGAAVVGVGIAAAAGADFSGGGYGGYTYDWDRIPNGYGGYFWRCRRSDGEFADDWHCPGPKIDHWR